jgi:hypothetical protein
MAWMLLYFSTIIDANFADTGGGNNMKVNCWEYKKCGREPGGSKARELGICLAARETKMDGVHGGSKAGRACWVVAGTLCGGQVQGSFAQKFKECEKCDFYLRVRDEEFPDFEYSTTLLGRLRDTA